ncbi:MAG TPA: NAD-dependent epimerase/dehydratase family protein, partial [Streptosporangiaceae bacterium]|nr:NAD-dependent epimerase/dehydratase family protein [Streptosporangiaceae bacterium]
MVAPVAQIVSAMQEAAPAGRPVLADAAVAELRALTQVLMIERADAIEELARFHAIRERRIELPESALAGWLRDRTVLVTGGTGCIGSTLMGQIARLGPRWLVSVSRGQTVGWPRHPEADYHHADVACRASLDAVFAAVRPDVVFHLAAQRDPGLAERASHLTISTNVLGTRNVVQACERHGVAELSYASSGKALRPYSREVYTAAKRACEWILAEAAARTEVRITASRFTHVVDNSIVYDKLLGWARSGVVRLHDWQTLFYAQSALESAELLLTAGLRAQPGGLRVYAIRDLGWPVSLLDLAIGTLLQVGSDSPIYFSGHDPGYERVPFPGLYDPDTAGESSPLLNAFEATAAEHDAQLGIDACPVRFDHSRAPAGLLAMVEQICAAAVGPEPVRAALDKLSWHVLDAALAALPQQVLSRIELLTAPHEGQLSRDHARMLGMIRQHA